MSHLRALLPAVLAVAAVALAQPSWGQMGPVVSVDAILDGSNTATSVGAIDTCRVVSSGATFTADVVIQGVTGITGMEGHLAYNPSVLRVTAVSYTFLIGSAGGLLVELGDAVPDSDGDFQLGVVTFPLIPASGSGVLARMTFQAIGTGTSTLDLQSVKLSDALGAPIPPADSLTGIFTGSVNDATAVAGGACSDTDGDGVPDASDNCPRWPNPTQALPPWVVPPDDPDCDGWSSANESTIGTNSNLACGTSAWPPDFNDDRIVDISDVNMMAPPVFFSTIGPWFPRRDIVPDGTIDISDVNLMAPPMFFQICTP